MTLKSVKIEPNQIKSNAKAQMGTPGKFNAFLGTVDAFAPMNIEIMNQAAGGNAAAILNGAFTGTSQATQSWGGAGAAPTAAGFGTGLGGYGALSEYPGMMGAGKYASGVVGAGGGTVPGDPSVYTGDLMSAMNSNNLKLLELQATMQSNMQGWQTKANILSADHRMRLAMIEKYTGR